MRISDWSSDVCSSDLIDGALLQQVFVLQLGHARRDDAVQARGEAAREQRRHMLHDDRWWAIGREARQYRTQGLDPARGCADREIAPVPHEIALRRHRRRAIQPRRSEEHTSELQSLMRISYAVFCLEKKKQTTRQT